jgi:hypothetical protein
MISQLNDSQRRQFGKLFVQIDPAVTEEAERMRVYERGTALYTGQLDLIEEITFAAGAPVPKLEVCAGKMLPDGQPGKLGYRNDTPILRIAIDTPDADVEIHKLLIAYLHSLDDKISAADLEKTHGGKPLRAVEHSGDDENTGFQLGGIFRSPYDLVDGPDPSKKQQNTNGDLYLHRRMRIHDPEQWQFWLDILFTHSMDRQKPHDWMRSLRTHAGLSGDEIAPVLGFKGDSRQTTYVQYEKKQRGNGILPYCRLNKLLLNNPFHWPVGKDDYVRDEYAEKLLRKMGYEPRWVDWRTGRLAENWGENIRAGSSMDTYRQAGFLLDALQMHYRVTDEHLELALGVSQRELTTWKIGVRPISERLMPYLITTFEGQPNAGDFDAECFREVAAKSNAAIREKHARARAEPTRHGRTARGGIY